MGRGGGGGWEGGGGGERVGCRGENDGNKGGQRCPDPDTAALVLQGTQPESVAQASNASNVCSHAAVVELEHRCPPPLQHHSMPRREVWERGDQAGSGSGPAWVWVWTSLVLGVGLGEWTNLGLGLSLGEGASLALNQPESGRGDQMSVGLVGGGRDQPGSGRTQI